MMLTLAMATHFPLGRSCLNLIVSTTASFLTFVCTHLHADPIKEQDLNAWLKNNSQENSQKSDIIYGAASISDLNSLAFAIVNPDSEIAIGSDKKKRFGKTREKKLLRKIRDKLKINLFRSESRRSNHHVYINALKGELVGKSRIGNTRYEIRLSEDEAEARFKWRF